MRSALAAALFLAAPLALGQTAVPDTTAASSATAKGNEPTLSHTIDAVKMTTGPTIDGTINEDEWKDVQSMTGMVDVNDGSPAPEPAIFWLGYDDNYIYFAARLHDSQPGSIKMTEYRTNVDLGGDDMVQFDIDPYGALTDWSHFRINPRGATNIEIAGGRAAKREWVGDFVAKTRMLPDGWEAEARIPWKLIKLPGAGKRDVRFDFDRFMSRTNRSYDWTNIVGGDLRGVGNWKGVDLPKIQEDRILQLLPYSYQGLDTHGGIANGGLDMKMPLTDQMTLVGTVNPDFRNIENQVLSLDFSRFERLAGESRPFFQEGQQYYSSALTATQRIKAFDAGINIYGKVNNKIALGLINTSDFGNENDFLTTMQYSPDASSNFRFSHTSLDSKDLQNQGYLFAYNRQVSKPLNIFFRGASTHDNVVGKGEERLASLNYNEGELNVFMQYRQISPKYLPRLGFTPETDFKGVLGSVGWNHQIKEGPIAEIFVDTYGTKYDHFAGGNYRRNNGGDLGIGFRNGPQVNANIDYSQFEGSNDHTNMIGIDMPRNDPNRNWYANYTWGEIESQNYTSVGIGSAYRPINKLQLSLGAQFVHHFENQRQIIFTGNYDLGNDKSISGRLVQQGDETNAYVALQRHGNAGMEYFLILGDPNALHFRSSLILKITYPLQMFLGKH